MKRIVLKSFFTVLFWAICWSGNVWAQSPQVTAIAPTAALPGASITITGSNFTGTTSVLFSGLPAKVTSISATQLTVTVPSSATSGLLRITTGSGTVVTPAFTVLRASNSLNFGSASGFNYTPYTYNGGKTAGNGSPAFTDLDGDGLTDLLVGTIGGTIELYEQISVNSLSFRQVTSTLISNSTRGYFAPAVTDIDGDGLLDLLVGDDQGFVNHYEQSTRNGTSFIYRSSDFFNIDLGRNAAPAVSDLDGDGLLDVLVGLYDGSIHHFKQNVANGLAFTQTSSAGAPFSNLDISRTHGYAQPKIVDLDGDGLLDLVVGGYDGITYLFEQLTPNGLIFDGNTTLIGDIGDNAAPALTDLNGDGIWDLLMGEWKDRLTYYVQAPSPKADVGVSLTTSAGTFALGKAITFTVTVTNNGPNSASSIKITDLLDPAKFTNITSSDANYVAANREWQVGSLISNASRTLTITARPSMLGSVTVLAAQTHAEVDVVPANNSASAVILVQPAADIEVKNRIEQSSYNNGDIASYFISVKNLGPSVATGVSVVTNLPEGFIPYGTVPEGFNSSSTTWTAGTLAVNETKTIKLQAQVTKVGSFTGTAVLGSRNGYEIDVNSSNNTSSSTTVVNPTAEVAVTSSVSSVSPRQGQEITFTIKVLNNGPNNATNVSVANQIPAGLSISGVETSSGTFNSSTGTWTVGTVVINGTQTLTLSAKPTAVGNFTLTSTQTHTENDGQTGNNSASSSFAVSPTADVAVTNVITSPIKATYSNDDVITYTVTVKNNGPSTANNVIITDKLPASLTFVSATNSTGTGTYTASTGTWEVGTLANGASATLTLSGRVNQSAIITTTATQTHTEYDNVSGNNSASNSITSGTGTITADIRVVTSVSAGPYYTGEEITLGVSVDNLGPDAAKGVSIEAPIPAGFTLVSAAPNEGTYNSSTGVWTIGDIASQTNTSSSQTNLELVVVPQADVTVTGDKSYTFTASKLTADEYDNNASNNTASSQITVKKAADASVTVAVTGDVNGVYYKGITEATFTLRVTNHGPDVLTNIQGLDTRTSTLNFTYVEPGKGYNAETGVWIINSLEPGDYVSLVVKGIPNITGRLNLGGSIVSADQKDLNPENDKAVALVKVVPVADLQVTNTAAAGPYYNGKSVNFTVTVTNKSTDAATGVIIEDILPTGLAFVSATTTAGTYSSTTGAWTLDTDLLAGTSQTMIITAIPSVATSYTTVAKVKQANEYDSNSANNSATAQITVQNTADIEVSNAIVSGPFYVGGQYQVQIFATNLGPDPATGVKIAAGVAPGLILVPGSGSPSPGTSIDASTGIWTIGDLGVNETKTLTLLAQPTTFGVLTSVGYKYAGNEFDPNGGNTRDGNNNTVITMEVHDQGATHQDFLNNQHFFFYQNNDVLSQITDPDGAIISSELASGSTLPAGINLSADGKLVITNKLLISPGSFSATVTTTDQNGGTTTQVLEYSFTADWDLDGIPDTEDQDDNNDGIPDEIAGAGADPFGDQDGDGILNYTDQTDNRSGSTYSHPTYGLWRDKNEDGINDWFDVDLDGIPNNLDVDMDGDGIANTIEANDGLALGSDVYSNASGTFLGSVDAVTGIPTNSQSNGTSILSMKDTDADGFKDFLDKDSDNDGILDLIEAQGSSVGKAGYLENSLTDTNRNGLDNTFDTANGGIEPFIPVNSDSEAILPDAVPDYLDTDADNDGMQDFYEGHDYNLSGISLDDYKQLALSYNSASGTTFYNNSLDSDRDGVPDWLEENNSNSPNFLVRSSSYFQDTNQDGLVDLFDADTYGTEAVPAQKIGAASADYRDATAVTPLPVTLLFFKAKAQQAGVLLSWATASEKDNAYFEVQRSTDGKNFSSIGKVTGHGTTNVISHYSFVDRNSFTGTVYYRLKQVDLDGKFENSKIVSAQANEVKVPVTVNAFPNPATDQVQLSFTGVTSGTATVKIFTLDGRLASSQQLEIGSAQKLDLNKLPAGMYLLRISGKDFETTSRVVKQ